MTLIAPLGRYRAFDANGDPLAGGKLYTYVAGTSTPKATYTSKDGTSANTNPVILDANGYADVWLDTGGYKFALYNSSDVLQWTKDDIDGGAATGFASQVVSKSSSFSLGINEQNQVLVCTASLTVSLLPAATAGDGFTAVIVNTSSGNVTIDPDGSELINNASTLVITAGNSATITTDGTAWYAFGYTQTPTEFSDSIFRIIDNGDATKKLAFEVSGVATGTTRTLTVQNKSGIVPLIETADILIPGTAAGPASISLAEDTDNGTNKVSIIAPALLSADRTVTLQDAAGTMALHRSGMVIQSTYTSLATRVTGTTVTPVDNTIPQTSEGTSVLTGTITPIFSNSILRVTVNTWGTSSTTNTITTFLTRDAGVAAVAATTSQAGGGGFGFTTVVRHQEVASTTSSTSFTLYAGPGAAGTIYINGNSTAALYGGVGFTTMVIEEVLP